MNVLVTGGANGIGKQTVRFLQQNDHEVTVFDRDKEALENLDCETIEGDASDEETVKQIVRENDFDAVVNSIGYYEQGAIEDMSDETARKIFDDTFFGTLNFCRHSADIIRENNGVIINVASVAGRISFPFYGVYCASKHSLEAATHALRMENSDSELDIVLVEPGIIDTGFNKRARQAVEKYIPDSRYSDIYKEKLEGRDRKGTEPEEVANVIIKALESENPKPRYKVTNEAFLGPFFQKIVPLKFWDKIVRKLVS